MLKQYIMNEIKKFRCWDKLNDRWVYFDLRDCLEHAPLKGLEPNKKTLQQYTGLNDNNGKEIYEGDIIEFDSKEWGVDDNIHIVTWNKEEAQFCFGGGCQASDMEFRTVIGNIFENPEKLKS